MTGWMIFLSDVLAGGVRIFVCLCLIRYVLGTSTGKEKGGIAASVFLVKCGAAAVLVSLVLAAALYMTDMTESVSVRMAAEAAVSAGCAAILLKKDLRMSLFLAIFYEIGAGLWQFLFKAWLGAAFGSQEFLDPATGRGQIGVWTFHLVLAGGAALFFRTAGRDRESGNEQKEEQNTHVRAASAVVVAGLLGVITLSEQTAIRIPDDTLMLWIIASVVLMTGVLAFQMNRQYEMEKKLAELKAEQAELLERDYAALNRAYAANARLFHDFHNHIGALQSLLSGGKYTEAMSYLNELQAPVREMADTVWTGDEAADYLINSKAAAAEQDGIRIKTEAEYPGNANIKSADLCAVLGNLLDNALEAARWVKDPEKREISLTIRRINQMIVIKVENSFEVPPIKKNGGLRTTKKESGLHGWGLKSAQNAAEKYDGTVSVSAENRVFRAVATLSCKEIRSGREEEQEKERE